MTTRRRPINAGVDALRARADAVGVTDAVWTDAPPAWWQRIAAQVDRCGAVLVLRPGGLSPLVILELATLEEAYGVAE